MGFSLTDILGALMALLGGAVLVLSKLWSGEKKKRKAAESEARAKQAHLDHNRRLTEASREARAKTDARVKEVQENPNENFPFDKPRT